MKRRRLLPQKRQKFIKVASGVANLNTARGPHKSAILSTPQISIQEFKMKEDHVSCFFKDTRISKAF